MVNYKQQNPRDNIRVQHNWLLEDIKNYWVFEDVQFDNDRIEHLYHEHRLNTIRANWKFILLMLKLLFSIVVFSNQFFEETVPGIKRFAPFLMICLGFVFKYLIIKSRFVARNGAIVFILIFGLLITRINLDITEFR